MPSQISSFGCSCKRVKEYKLLFDGGSSGKYVVNLCVDCYDEEDKRFLISEERLKK